MNLPPEWQVALTSPIVIALLALTGATLLVVFLGPVFFKAVQKTKFPQRLEFIKRHPRRSLVAAVVVLFVLAAGYLFYYYSQPVRIVSAAQLKLEKGKAMELTQQGYSGRDKAKFYFLDVRSRAEYAVEHLKGSASLPAENTAEASSDVKMDVAIYSSAARFSEARRVADTLKKNTNLAKKGKVGKIYVIRDGFEGLKAAGLATEPGIWD